MSENNVATASETTTTAREENKPSIVDSLFDIGVAWAKHGLKVGQSALETSAKTLHETAKVLESVSTDLTKKA